MKERINTPVTNKTIGEILHQQRKLKGFTLKDVSAQTKIRSEFLDALERNDYSVFASDVYVKGFLRNYAKFLGLDLEKVMAVYRRELQPEKKKSTSGTPDAPKPLVISRRAMTVSLLTIVILLVGTFFVDRLGGVLAPPELTITSPFELNADFEGDVSFAEDSIILSGTTSARTLVHLNSEPLQTDAENKFTSSEIPLQGERTLLILTATNQFGRNSTIKMNIIKDEQLPTEIVIDLEVVRDAIAFSLENDGKLIFNERAFPGDKFDFTAQQEVVLTTQEPENLLLKLNDEIFELKKGKNTFVLEEGSLSSKQN